MNPYIYQEFGILVLHRMDISVLNSHQRAAVLQTEGPVMILAGAGSGKTRCLTYRVAYLVQEKKVPGDQILCLTFTNKAGNEMKERITSLITQNSPASPAGGQQTTPHLIPFAGTFHSFCAKMIRRHGHIVGLSPSFVIYDTDDQIDVVKQILKDLDIDPKRNNPRAIHASISQAKNELLEPQVYARLAKGYFQEIVARVYLLYQANMKEQQAVDFDDLLVLTARLLKEDKTILSKYHDQFKYIMVDEYQDTNHAQYTITKLLASGSQNISVVGDAAQSIYAWRGADYRNLVRFKEDFPDTKVFHLEQNYRSTQEILDAAYGVISKNTSHPVLKLWTENGKGERITLYEASNEQDESTFILKTIRELSAIYPYKSFAVLYRTNAQSRTVEEAFLHESVPYILVGGVRFYERAEVKDVLCYLRLLANEKDKVAFRRGEKIGKKRLEAFFMLKESIKETLKDYKTLDLLDMILKETRYLEKYDPENEEDRQRLENIKELRSVATEFPDIDEFLENVALVEQEYYPDKAIGVSRDAVTLMTLHAAKGLEFDVVFMIGMEEGLFPHSRSLLDAAQLEEERRLCYVGMTRAKKRLYITYASRRLYFGARMSNMVSRFVGEIPEDVIRYVNKWESGTTEYDTAF